MALTQDTIKKITKFVKKEPRTIQEVAKHIGRSWMTADSYVEKIIRQTGQLQMKVFRGGTKGALKIVYWNYEETAEADEIKKRLYDKVRLTKREEEFDPFDIYQFVVPKKKRCLLELYDDPWTSVKQGLVPLLRQTESELYCFSGKNSWINVTEKGIKVSKVIEELLKRKVHIKVLCRVDLASLEHLNKISRLMQKYPEQLEIRHAVQPLRGFIIDGKLMRFKDEKDASVYAKGTKRGKKLRVFYDILDDDWIHWTTQVFWNLFRGAPTAEERLKQLNKIF